MTEAAEPALPAGNASILAHDPYAALRFPEYRSFILSAFLLTVAVLMQEVALGYEIYRITKDPLALGMIGLAEALPFIGLSLYGGHIADRKSKRTIILLATGTMTAGSTLLLVFSRSMPEAAAGPSAPLIGAMYATVFLVGLCRAFHTPAASSLRAFLVPVHTYENAATWSSSAWQAGSVIGPAAGGFLYSWVGFSNTLLAVAGLLAAALFLFSRVSDKSPPAPAVRADVLESVTEGIRFVWKTKPILYAISLDLFSVLFGGVVALLPIYAQDILQVGAQGLGILRAAPAVGAVITLLILSRYSAMRHAWRNLLLAVAGFGASVLVFALSPWMALSVAALFLSGAFDSVSVVIRQTLLQLLTPDAMRGRVMAVNGIFVSSSNELGAFESGVAARLLGVIPSAVVGGVMTLLIVGWLSWRSPELIRERFDRR
jgi:MFS family permease